MFGKVGRPPEDHLLRQREIYEAVAPLIMSIGPRRLTMRQAAHAASISVGGLYHYFPDKRSLVLHGLQSEAHDRLCEDFYREHGHLERTDPERILELFLDFQVREVEFVRPALHAALELGGEAFWDGLEQGVTLGVEDYVRILRQALPEFSEDKLRERARLLRRLLFAGLLDRSVSADELREDLRALLVPREYISQRPLVPMPA